MTGVVIGLLIGALAVLFFTGTGVKSDPEITEASKRVIGVCLSISAFFTIVALLMIFFS